MANQFREIIVKSINLVNSTYVNSSNQTMPFAPKDIYLVPTVNKKHDRYVVDNNGIISKQNGADGDAFIPITGTLPNKNVTGVIYSESRTILDTEWGTAYPGSRAYLSQVTGLTQNKTNYVSSLRPDLFYVEDVSNQGHFIKIEPEQGITGGMYYQPLSDFHYIQRFHLTRNYYTQAQVDALLIHNRFVEDETNVTEPMMSPDLNSVTLILSQPIDENLERTVFYNGVMIPRTISIVNNNNELIINLLPLGLKARIGDFIVVKYYKQI